MPRLRVLQIRSGARYRCESDGLCCSDVHALGPLTRGEGERVVSYDPESVMTHPRLGLLVLRPREDHTCRFFDFDQGCRIHRERGALAKPGACRQYPFGLVKTATGLRVTTAHRCPCRTMGDRAPLDVEEARAALTHGGRLRIDQTVGERVRMTRRRRLGWAKYQRFEASLLDGLLAGSLIDTLMPPECIALPSIMDARWADVAHSHRAMIDGSTTGEALAWFGDALLFVLESKPIHGHARHRPWAWSFDRAERRVAPSERVRSPRALYADFAADRIYGLRWCEESSLAGELLSLQVALGCAAVIADALFAASSANATVDTAPRRRERATAEAIMVAEVALAGPIAHLRFETAAESAMLSNVGIA